MTTDNHDRKSRLLVQELLQYVRQPFARASSYVPDPVEAAVFVTRRCNSRCSMCSFWQCNDSSGELSCDELRGVFDQLRQMGTTVVSLSGEGEMTLRSDLPEIMRAISERGFLFSSNSNFLRVPDPVLEAFTLPGHYQATIGFDTLNPEKYLAIRGIRDGVERVTSAIQRLKALGFNGIALGTIVLHNNLDDLLPLVDWVKAQSLAGIRFTAFQPFGFGKKWEPGDIQAYRDPAYLARLEATIRDLLAAKRQGAPIINSAPYLSAIPQSYTREPFFPVACRTPWRRIHILSNGDVSLCQVMGARAVIGNVRQDPLPAIWRSERAREVRALVRRQGCGGCWLSCYAETNLRFSARHAVPLLVNNAGRFLRLKE